MTLKVMASEEEARGPKNIKKYLSYFLMKMNRSPLDFKKKNFFFILILPVINKVLVLSKKIRFITVIRVLRMGDQNR
jgi:hypothetical protein